MDEEQDGLRVVLSPVQLAAVLDGEHLSAHEILMNRLWGGARAAGGTLELVAGGGLLLAPEPTMLTKVGGGVLVAHGSDTTIAGARQLWSGEETKDLTQVVTEATALSLGASEKNAERIGTGVDVGSAGGRYHRGSGAYSRHTGRPLLAGGGGGCGRPYHS